MSGLTTNRRLKFIINIVFYAMCLALVYFALKFLPGLFMPFIFALLIVLVTNPIVNAAEKKLKIPRKVGGPIIVLFAILLLVAFIYFLITVVLAEASDLVKDLADILKSLPQKFEEFSGKYDIFLDGIQLPEALKNTFDFNNIVSGITTSVSKSLDLQNILSGLITNASAFIFGFFIMIVATVLLSADYPRVRGFVMRQLSPKYQKTMHNVKVFMKHTVWGYTKTYSIIFAFYFVAMYIIFLVMNIPHALLLAFLIGIVDLLPVLGLGAVLIPWSVISFISGNVWMGIVLIVSYIVLTFARNLIEPKLIGKQVGIHPLVALLSIYIGLRLFGVIGIFLVPLAVILAKSENDAGRLHLWK